MSSNLKLFKSHGVDFISDEIVNDHQIAECPFCGKKKFYVNVETQCWDCKVCGRSGNRDGFLTSRVQDYIEAMDSKRIRALVMDRGLLPMTLKAWGVGWYEGKYTIPTDANPKNVVTGVKFYTLGGRRRASSGSKLCMIKPQGDLSENGDLWVCEGEWDAMALWQIFFREGYAADVVATPGAAAFPVVSLPMFNGRTVNLVYDNDLAGSTGMNTAKKKLSGIAKEIRKISWPTDTDDGYDIRDLIKDERKRKRNPRLKIEEYIGIRQGKKKPLKKNYESIPSPATTARVFKKWLFMSNTECLDVIFGTVLANKLQGDPLWLFLVAPPGGMKSELLMSLSASPAVYTTTSLTPRALISGAQMMGGGDPSLIPKLDGKVLVIKDFTAILKLHKTDRDEIFGLLRDAYDGRIEKPFGNGITRVYESSFGILAGVTPAIETVGAAEGVLGQRFIRYNLPRASGSVMAGRSAVKRAMQNLRHSDQMRGELKEVATRVLDREIIDFPDISEHMMEQIGDLAQWISLLRGVVSKERYTGIVQFKPMAEVGTRLAKELSKLAYGIALYRDDHEIGEDVYNILVSVARSTIPDRIESITRILYVRGRIHLDELIKAIRLPRRTVQDLLEDMSMLKLAARKDKQWDIQPGIRKLIDHLDIYHLDVNWEKRKHVKT